MARSYVADKGHSL